MELTELESTDVWRNLDVEEATEVRKWLLDPERGLNLTRWDHATDRLVREKKSLPNADMAGVIRGSTSLRLTNLEKTSHSLTSPTLHRRSPSLLMYAHIHSRACTLLTDLGVDHARSHRTDSRLPNRSIPHLPSNHLPTPQRDLPQPPHPLQRASDVQLDSDTERDRSSRPPI